MYFVIWVGGHNITQMVVKKYKIALVFLFTTIFVIATAITEWLLFRVLLWGSYCRFDTQYDPHSKRKKVVIIYRNNHTI